MTSFKVYKTNGTLRYSKSLENKFFKWNWNYANIFYVHVNVNVSFFLKKGKQKRVRIFTINRKTK